MNRVAFILLIGALLAGCGESTPMPEEYAPKIYAVEQQELAAAAMRAGDDITAMAAAERALAHDPKYPEPYAIKACILARKGELASARMVLDVAVAERPDFAEGFLMRGALLEELQELDAARVDYATAADQYVALVAAKPKDPSVAMKYALAEYLRGGMAGLRAINTLVTKFPDYQAGQFVKERMDAGDRAFAFRWITDQKAAPLAAPKGKDPQ